MADRDYTVCYVCRKIWCNSRLCESPKPECQEVCPTVLDMENVKYDFCGVCVKNMRGEFERQFARKKLLPKLRMEDDKPPDKSQ